MILVLKNIRDYFSTFRLKSILKRLECVYCCKDFNNKNRFSLVFLLHIEYFGTVYFATFDVLI